MTAKINSEDSAHKSHDESIPAPIKAYVNQQIKNVKEEQSDARKKKWKNSWRSASPITQGTFIASAVAAGATVIYTVIAVFQLVGMGISITNANDAERPWVGAVAVAGFFDPTQNIKGATVRVINGGHSTATHVSARMSLALGVPIPSDHDPEEFPKSAKCTANTKLDDRILIPNTAWDVVLNMDQDVLAGMPDVAANKKGLYIVGCIIYRDSNGKGRYQTNIVRKYAPPARIFSDNDYGNGAN